MLNRTQQPTPSSIDKIEFATLDSYELSRDVRLFHMKNVPNETARMDLYFDAGKCRETDGIPSLVSGLLLSGTRQKSSVEIQHQINGLGGFMESGISVENSVITVYSLREHLLEIAEVLLDAIRHTAFFPKEVDELVNDRRQSWLIKREKVNFLAQESFQQQLFESDPRYSRPTAVEDFENVDIDRLKDFHKKHYQEGLLRVVVVGNIEESVLEKLIHLSRAFVIPKMGKFTEKLHNAPGRRSIRKEGALQTAIRVGRTLFNKKHRDYPDFLILNTIVGDYFGSRLMKNLREEKGYTYGVGSMLAELNHTGYFLIATEVGKDVCEDALHQIKVELQRLRETEVSPEELTLVKNYMLGQLLKSADGPYAMTDLFMSAELQGKSLEFYNELLQAIHAITPKRIQELAQNYLKWEDMSITMAG